MRCKECKFFERSERKWDAPPNDWLGAGHCSRWHQSYGADTSAMKPNDCWVESDEGWANFVGPEFGCVLWEAK